MPGPPPKSAVEKELSGNPGRRPYNEDEPEPAAGAPPRPPSLDALAGETWDWLVETLAATRTLRVSDQSVMRRYCVAYSRSVALEKAINRQNMVDPVGGVIAESEKGTTYISALASAESMYVKILEKAEKELGLTPASRTRVHADKPTDANAGNARFFPKLA